ncbi:MAG: metal-dependent transcriptional regulator [Planctomycetota bacterium]
MADQLTSTLERYLEAVYRLERERGAARVRDIAERVEVHKSTVTSALRSLAEKGLVNYEPYEAITLTPEGRRRGRRLDLRHRVISDFLSHVLGVEAEAAERNACRMEHAMDQRVLEHIVCFLTFLQRHPRMDAEWVGEFRRFSEGAVREKSCQDWIEEYLATAEE